MNNIKPFGFKRNINFLKESFIILFKTIFEYKSHVYAILLDGSVWFFSQFIVLYVIGTEFSDIVSWDIYDMLLLAGLINIAWGFMGIFEWGTMLFKVLIKGDMNTILTKPISPSLKTYFSNLDESGFFFLLMAIIYTIFTIFYFKIKLYNILLGSFLFALNIITFILFWLMIDSFNLYVLGIRSIFMPLARIEEMFQMFPGQFFAKMRLRYFF